MSLCCHYLQRWTHFSLPFCFCPLGSPPSSISESIITLFFFLSDFLFSTHVLYHLPIFHSFPCSFSSVIYSLWLLGPPSLSLSLCPHSVISLPLPYAHSSHAHWLAFPFLIAHIHTRVALLWWEDRITLTQYLKFSPTESDWVSKLQRWALYSCL